MRRPAAVVAVAVALGGAIATDAMWPAAAPRAPAHPVPTGSGALACPIATIARADAHLFLANVGDQTSRARVTLVPARGRPAVIRAAVGPGHVGRIRLHDRVRAPAAALVEFVGGELVASHFLGLERSRGGFAEAACRSAGASVVAVARGRTLRAETTLALFNPGSADADVSVTLVSDGLPARPERLAKRVIRAHTRRDFRLGDFAFDARDVTAIVRATSGRIVAEGLLRAPTGAELLPGQEPARSSVAISGATGKGVAGSVTGTAGDASVLEARVLGIKGATAAPDSPVSLSSLGARSFGIAGPDRFKPGAFAYEVAGGSPVVAGTTWGIRRGSSRDLFSLPAAVPARAWAGVIGATSTRARAIVLIANPGTVDAAMRLRIIGRSVTLREPIVPPGRVLAIRIGSGAGAFAVEASASAPVAVALVESWLSASRRVGAFGCAATTLTRAAAVRVSIDPAAAVPAVPRAR